MFSQNTGLSRNQISVISLLFNLLLKAIKKLSECETWMDRDVPLPDKETKLCTLLELLVKMQLVKELFLNDMWLVQLGQGLRSDHQQKKKTRRKSAGASPVDTFVDYLCSSNIGEILHTAVESCSKFSRSCVYKLAVSRLFSGFRVVLGEPHHCGAIGECMLYCHNMYMSLACICVNEYHEYDDHDQEPELCGLSAESYTH